MTRVSSRSSQECSVHLSKSVANPHVTVVYQKIAKQLGFVDVPKELCLKYAQIDWRL